MDWQQELISALFWLFKAFFWVSLVLALSAWALKFTTFGQKLWRVIQPCLSRTSLIKSLAMMGLLVFFVLLEVKISVLNTQFYNQLYSALQDVNAKAFWTFALLNAILMMFKVVQEVVDRFIGEAFEIKWLEKLNQVLLGRYFSHKNYYHLKHFHTPDNIDQRIEQDAREFITTTVEMMRGVLNAVMSIIEFTIILWGLSGILSIFGIQIPKGIVFFLFMFIVLATALSVWIGRPLVALNFEKERLQGDYRYSLIRVQEYADSIALYHGEQQEKQHLSHRFNLIISNRWLIIRRLLGLDGFNTGVTQVAQLLPLMLQAPRFFAGEIKLGDMQQTVQSFVRLMRALSFFRLFYETFTLYQARLNRLYGFLEHIDKLPATHHHRSSSDDNALVLHDFGLHDVHNQPMLSGINITLKQGESLLIQGSSGIGKTTLLKAMAGIYPYQTTGVIMVNDKLKQLFIPQYPYMPQGTLRYAICYPNHPIDDEQLTALMTLCHLGKYLHSLDEQKDWQKTLSPGELQCVAFLRILLTEPDMVFLDEISSALDETKERYFYTLLKHTLPNLSMVSVGHRSTLNEFHDKFITLTNPSCQS